MMPIEDLRNALELYKSINLYGRDNAMESTITDEGKLLIEMRIQDKHLSSPNVCHGAVIAGLMDSIMGGEALLHAMPDGKIVSTIEFKINYLMPVFLDEVLLATAELEYHGKSTIVVHGKIIKKESGKTVAIAIGTFNKYALDMKKFSRV